MSLTNGTEEPEQEMKYSVTCLRNNIDNDSDIAQIPKSIALNKRFMIDSEVFDPLEPGDESGIAASAAFTRVKNILSDYNGIGDMLAEPVQNAMDAIDRVESDNELGWEDNESPELEVKVDAATNYIEVTDNGRGFPRNEVKRLIAPEYTNKQPLFEKQSSRGHKGVGLTYQAYGFDELIIESIPRKDGQKPYRLELTGGISWVTDSTYSDVQDRPEAEISEVDPNDLSVDEYGTYVHMEAGEDSSPKNFKRTLNNPQKTQAMIECLTALGILYPQSESHRGVDATLKYRNDNTEPFEEYPLRDEFRYPHIDINRDTSDDGVFEYDVTNVDDNDIYDDEGNLKKSEKSTYNAVYKNYEPSDIVDLLPDDLQGKDLDDTEEYKEYINDNNLNVYVLFSWSTKYEDRIEEQWDIAGPTTFYKSGKRIGTDGMISGYHESVNISFGKFETRTWLMYNFEGISPDTGRDDFNTKVGDIVRDTENRLFRHIRKEYEKLLSEESKITGGEAPEKKAYKGDALSPTDFGKYGEIRLENVPSQENDVISLFNQLVGGSLLKCFQPFFFSSSSDYDSYMTYKTDKVPTELNQAYPGLGEVGDLKTDMVVEFKLEGKSILNHVNKRDRSWTDIDLLVCWTLVQEPHEDGGRTVRFDDNISKDDRLYAGVTHLADVDNRREPIRVICLSDLVDTMHQKLS